VSFSSSASKSILRKGNKSSKPGKKDKKGKGNQGNTKEENSKEITPAMNSSGGTEKPESPFRSFGEGRKAPTSDGKAISRDGEIEKRKVTKYVLWRE
jgi:hypothetical protein